VAIIEKSRRDQGLLLTAGALPHEAKALELKLAQLELIEARATAHFTGTDLGPTEEILCEVVFPRKGGSVELLTYRHSEGVLSASSRCEMPADLFAEAAPENGALASDASQEHSVTLNWRLVEGLGAIPKKLAKTRKTGDTQSFAYRMPAAADVWLTDGGEPLTQRERWWIPQLGEVFRLTRMKSGGKSQVALEFDPETGALLAIQSQSAGPNVGALAGGAGEGWAAIEEARSRRAASDPELARALRDEQYFEALANVRAARAILEEAPLEQPSPSQETEPAAPLAPAPTEPTAPQP
jgi:hypothetical protein